MKELIEEIKEKLDRLDDERRELEEKLEVKRYQLKKVDSMISKLEALETEQQ